MSYYRKNKYGEPVCVSCDECGSCGNYDFLREDDTNKCRVWGKYYRYTETCCKRWNRSEEVYSGGCFLTTACCEYKGLADNTYELEVMRYFRDNVLMNSEVGRTLVKHYYEVAPLLVVRIDQCQERTSILEWIYRKILCIVQFIDEGKINEAIAEYVLLVWETEQKVTYGFNGGDGQNV